MSTASDIDHEDRLLSWSRGRNLMEGERMLTTRDKRLAAYMPTGDGDYPPYIAISHIGGMVEISVRSEEQEDGSCGARAKIIMKLNDFVKLINEAHGSLEKFSLAARLAALNELDEEKIDKYMKKRWGHLK